MYSKHSLGFLARSVFNKMLLAVGLQLRVEHKPRLLSDNGPCYISQELALWLKGQGMRHVRGAPNHPQTQGKIERWHALSVFK